MNNISGSNPRIEGIAAAAETRGPKVEEKKGESIKDTVKKSDQRKTEYKGELKRPILDAPTKESKAALSMNQQKVVKFEFDRYVSERIQGHNLSEAKAEAIHDAIKNPEKVKDLDAASAKLAKKIDHEATDAIRERFKLNEDWNIRSQDKSSWTPEKAIAVERTVQLSLEDRKRIEGDYQQALQKNMETYIHANKTELTPAIITGLREGLRTGQPSQDIQLHYDYVNTFTVDNIRSDNLLPATWAPKSERLEDWKALPAGSIDPIRAAQVYVTSLMENSKNFVAETGTVAKALAETLPADDANKPKLKGTEMSVYHVLREIEKNMKAMQFADADILDSVAGRRKGAAEEQYEYAKLKSEEYAKLVAKQKETDRVVNIIKWVAYGVAALVGVIAIAITVATTVYDVIVALVSGGATVAASVALKAIIIGLIVGGITAALAGTFMILDKHFGLTAQVMAWATPMITEALNVVAPGQPQWVKDMIKYTVAAVILFLAFVVLVATVLISKGLGTAYAASVFGNLMTALSNLSAGLLTSVSLQMATTVASIATCLVVPMALADGWTEQEAQLIANFVLAGCIAIISMAFFIFTVGKGGVRILKGGVEGLKLVATEAIASVIQTGKLLFSALKFQLRTGEQLLQGIRTIERFFTIFPIDKFVNFVSEMVAGGYKIDTARKSAAYEKYAGTIDNLLHVAEQVSRLITKHLNSIENDFKQNQEVIAELTKMITSLLDRNRTATSNLYNAA